MSLEAQVVQEALVGLEGQVGKNTHYDDGVNRVQVGVEEVVVVVVETVLLDDDNAVNDNVEVVKVCK